MIDESEMADIEAAAFHAETSAGDEPVAAPRLHEPPAAPEADPQAFQMLVHLFRRGTAPIPETELQKRSLLPLHLFAYRDLTQMRTPYPLLVRRDGADLFVRPLCELIDDCRAALALEGDERGMLDRLLSRLEVSLRRHLGRSESVESAEAWRASARRVLSRTRRSALSPDLLRDALREPAELSGGTFYGCTASAAEAVFRETARARVAADNGLGAAIRRAEEALQQLLAIDTDRRADASDPQHLQASVGQGGADDFDFAAFSDVMKYQGPALSDERRERIEKLALQLTEERAFFADDAGRGPVVLETTSCAEAAGLAATLKQRVVDVTRALRRAHLELEHRYQPDQHEAYFAGFGWDDLSDTEKHVVPPVLLFLDSDALRPGDTEYLFELLGSDLPIKVFLTVRRVFDTPATPVLDGPAFTAAASLGWMAVALHRPFVLQTSLAQVNVLVQGIRQGVQFHGTALFSVYAGQPNAVDPLPPYLRAAVAVESRAFPAFRYDPAAGQDWATRFSIVGNPLPEAPWTGATVPFTAADGNETTLDLPFTTADFLACEPRCRRYVRVVPPGLWDDRMMPLADYLEAEPATRHEAVPYILLHEPDGTIHRAVVTKSAVRAVRAARDRWLMIREMAGVASSHAAAAVAREREVLAEESRAAVEAVRNEYESRLNEERASAAHDIVSKLAAALLDVPLTGDVAPPSPPRSRPPTPEASSGDGAAPEAQPAPAPAPPEPDEPMSFDDPYVETARCTSCNECTNLNGMLFGYDGNKQAYIKDADAGTFKDLVVAAEKCPVRIIHPGKPRNAGEAGLDALVKRAEPFQ